MCSRMEDKAIQLFAEILRFPTVSATGPTSGSYNECGQWLLERCSEIGLDAKIIPESKENKPIVVAEWLGSDPRLPCIHLNSHYDVVPIIEGSWTVPPFQGHRENGRIYGRGAQDMKCVVVQYLVAIERLKESGYSPLRTLRLSFVPDEEIGGVHGMKILMSSQWFSETEIAIALDEGLASEDEHYSIFYGERLPWWLKVTAHGNTGHASRLIDGTAVEQLMGVVNRAMRFRYRQRELLQTKCANAGGCSHSVAAFLGDVTSLNMTKIHSNSDGSTEAFNVIPAVVQAGFDIRLSPHVDPSDMLCEIDTWCREAQEAVTGVPDGGGIQWEFDSSTTNMVHSTTSTDAAANPWWGAITQCLLSDHEITAVPMVFPAATDSRFLREMGIKAFGFSPMRRSPILLHEHDEYLEESVFLEGCSVYVSLLRKLSSQDGSMES